MTDKTFNRIDKFMKSAPIACVVFVAILFIHPMLAMWLSGAWLVATIILGSLGIREMDRRRDARIAAEQAERDAEFFRKVRM